MAMNRSSLGLQRTSAYKNVPMAALKVSDLDVMYQGLGGAAHKYILAVSYTNLRLHPTYHEEQMRYLALGYHDLASALTTISLNLEVEQKKCLQAIKSFGEIQGDASYIHPRDDVFYCATKLKCAYTSYLISGWADRDNMGVIGQDIKKVFSDVISILETRERKQRQVNTSKPTSPANRASETLSSPSPQIEPAYARVEPLAARVNVGSPDTPSSTTPGNHSSTSNTALEVDLSSTNTIPWSEFEGFDDLREDLTTRLALRTMRGYRRPYAMMPPVVLLHGVEGVGKVSFVYSFAKEHNLPLWVIGPKSFNLLMSESISVLDTLIAQHRERASAPVVLLLEEADLFLCDPLPEDSHLRLFQSSLNSTWDRLEVDKTPVFIFVTTNKPEKISEAYVHRKIEEVVHIQMPGPAARVRLLRNYLRNVYHNVTADYNLDISIASTGYTGSDINKLLNTLTDELNTELYLEATNFSWVDDEGMRSLMPDSAGAVEGPYNYLNDDEQSHAVVRTVTTKMLVYKFKSGSFATANESREQEHTKWQRKVMKAK